MIRHPEFVIPCGDWRSLVGDIIVGGVHAYLMKDHGAAEASRFMTEIGNDYGRNWRAIVRRWVTVAP